MTKLSHTLIAASLAVATPIVLVAQELEESPHKGRFLYHGPSPLFIALDLDGDGVISTEEIARAPESLAALDRDGDGQLAVQEIGPHMLGLRQPREEGEEPRIMVRRQGDEAEPQRQVHLRSSGEESPKRIKILCPIFTALDIDRDGALSPEEIADSWKTLLDFDANGDGALTPEEIRPHRLIRTDQ